MGTRHGQALAPSDPPDPAFFIDNMTNSAETLAFPIHPTSEEAITTCVLSRQRPGGQEGAQNSVAHPCSEDGQAHTQLNEQKWCQRSREVNPAFHSSLVRTQLEHCVQFGVSRVETPLHCGGSKMVSELEHTR